MSRIPITVAGESFASIVAACRRYGVPLTVAARRLRDGWSAEQALGVEPPPPVRHDGREIVTSVGVLRSISEGSARFGVKEDTIRARLAAGWTPDEAVGLIPHKRPPKRTRAIQCEGKLFPNAEALGAAYGLNPPNVAKRLRAGWTPEQAVGLEAPPPRFRNQVGGGVRPHVWKNVAILDGKTLPASRDGEYKVYVIRNSVNGKEYVGITISPLWQRFNGHRAAARKGLKTKLYNAIRLHGEESFSIELVRNDAQNFAELQKQEMEEIQKRGTIESGYNVSPGGSVGTPDPVVVAGVTFGSRSAAAAHFGIDERVFNIRVGRLGWTPEEAAEIEPRRKFVRRKVFVSGLTFPSLHAAAKHFGVDYRLVHDRVASKGWSTEQALGVEPEPDTVRYRGTVVRAFGRTFKSYAECAMHFGVKSESLRKRVVDMGSDIESSITHLLARPRAGRRK